MTDIRMLVDKQLFDPISLLGLLKDLCCSTLKPEERSWF